MPSAERPRGLFFHAQVAVIVVFQVVEATEIIERILIRKSLVDGDFKTLPYSLPHVAALELLEYRQLFVQPLLNRCLRRSRQVKPRRTVFFQLGDPAFLYKAIPHLGQHMRVDPLVKGACVGNFLFQGARRRDPVLLENPQ